MKVVTEYNETKGNPKSRVMDCQFFMFWAIWYHLYNFKNVKNTHGRVLLLVKLQASKLTIKTPERRHWNILPWVFFMFFKSINGTKSRNASHINLPIKIIQALFVELNLIFFFSSSWIE